MNGNSSAPEKSTFLVERRSGIVRRRRGLPLLFSSPRRRRSKGRRKTDEADYVDIYDFRTWAVTISILVLSLIDALLTWFQISQGRASEANPLMYAVIRWGGAYPFFGVKIAMTAFPLAILMLHKEWRLARFAARICLWSYILIALYHFYLVSI